MIDFDAQPALLRQVSSKLDVGLHGCGPRVLYAANVSSHAAVIRVQCRAARFVCGVVHQELMRDARPQPLIANVRRSLRGLLAVRGRV